MAFQSTLEKTRYFRNLLLTDNHAVRIIIGPCGKLHALYEALPTLVGLPLNPLCIIEQGNPVPRLVVLSQSRPGPPILVYLRTSHDALVDALVCDYGSEGCELVFFEAPRL